MDKILLASAASRVGDDTLAARTTREILEDARVGSQATQIFLESYANLRMEREWPSTVAVYGDWNALDPLWRGPAGTDPSLRFIQAVYLWNRGARQEAAGYWRAIASDPGDPKASHAVACLLLTGTMSRDDEPILNSYLVSGGRRMTPVLFSALTSRLSPERLTPPQAELARMYERMLGLAPKAVEIDTRPEGR